MNDNNPTQWAGEQVGHVLRWVVEGLAWLLTHIGSAFHSFYQGLRESLGMSPSIGALIVLVIGLLLLVAGMCVCGADG